MAPSWFTSENASNNETAREAARLAARRRKDIYLQIRLQLSTLYPSHPNLIVRSQQTAGLPGRPNFTALVLVDSSRDGRLTARNPVTAFDENYYDDRLLEERDLERFALLLSGAPGRSQAEGLERLLERLGVLVRSGWRAEM